MPRPGPGVELGLFLFSFIYSHKFRTWLLRPLSLDVFEDLWGPFLSRSSVICTLLYPDNSLLRFPPLRIRCITINKTSFIQDEHCHLTLCLHLIESIYCVSREADLRRHPQRPEVLPEAGDLRRIFSGPIHGRREGVWSTAGGDSYSLLC